jgi:hypothetical protein
VNPLHKIVSYVDVFAASTVKEGQWGYAYVAILLAAVPIFVAVMIWPELKQSDTFAYGAAVLVLGALAFWYWRVFAMRWAIKNTDNNSNG